MSREFYTIEFLTNDDQSLCGPVSLFEFNSSTEVNLASEFGIQENIPAIFHRINRYKVIVQLEELNENILSCVRNGLEINIKIKRNNRSIINVPRLRVTSIEWNLDLGYEIDEIDESFTMMSTLNFMSYGRTNIDQYTPILIDQVMASYGYENCDHLRDWPRLGF